MTTLKEDDIHYYNDDEEVRRIPENDATCSERVADQDRPAPMSPPGSATAPMHSAPTLILTVAGLAQGPTSWGPPLNDTPGPAIGAVIHVRVPPADCPHRTGARLSLH
jgi:hypothetical protein